MRKIYDEQLPLSVTHFAHPRSAELRRMSEILDAVASQVLPAVHHDLPNAGKVRNSNAGREAMTAEQVLRAAVIKQMFNVSYQDLSFLLDDSLQLRAFCRMSPSASAPKKSALQANISAISAQTLEAVNQAVVRYAHSNKIEKGKWLRTDATVIESNIHDPTDSTLLYDCVRVLTRIVCRTHEKFDTPKCNQKRRAKRRSIGILNAGTMPRAARAMWRVWRSLDWRRAVTSAHWAPRYSFGIFCRSPTK
jgi:IS5 family transposase